MNAIYYWISKDGVFFMQINMVLLFNETSVGSAFKNCHRIRYANIYMRMDL